MQPQQVAISVSVHVSKDLHLQSHQIGTNTSLFVLSDNTMTLHHWIKKGQIAALYISIHSQ